MVREDPLRRRELARHADDTDRDDAEVDRGRDDAVGGSAGAERDAFGERVGCRRVERAVLRLVPRLLRIPAAEDLDARPPDELRVRRGGDDDGDRPAAVWPE